MELKYFDSNNIPQMIRIYTIVVKMMNKMGCHKSTIAYLTKTKLNDVDWASRESFPLRSNDKDFARENVNFFRKYLKIGS